MTYPAMVETAPWAMSRSPIPLAATQGRGPPRCTPSSTSDLIAFLSLTSIRYLVSFLLFFLASVYVPHKSVKDVALVARGTLPSP
jgi:hypothetical protein